MTIICASCGYVVATKSHAVGPDKIRYFAGKPRCFECWNELQNGIIECTTVHLCGNQTPNDQWAAVDSLADRLDHINTRTESIASDEEPSDG